MQILPTLATLTFKITCTVQLSQESTSLARGENLTWLSGLEPVCWPSHWTCQLLGYVQCAVPLEKVVSHEVRRDWIPSISISTLTPTATPHELGSATNPTDFVGCNGRHVLG